MPLPSINFQHLTVSEIQPRQTFLTAHPPKCQPDYPETMDENDNLTTLQGCAVKMVSAGHKNRVLLKFSNLFTKCKVEYMVHFH